MKNGVLKTFTGAIAFVVLCHFPQTARAFSLLGPYAPWMTSNLGYKQPGDLGGPMALGEGYRWNVPVVTYGFDQSFVQYFGQPGIDAVEKAIKIINDLPAASSVVLSNYPFGALRINALAQEHSLLDLKSVTLPMLMAELGLASPIRNIWTLRRWDENSCQWLKFKDLNGYFVTLSENIPPDPIFSEYILQRNYSPMTGDTSHLDNEYEYDFKIISSPDCSSAQIQEFSPDPSSPSEFAVCDNEATGEIGTYYMGLTFDDVGGLAYLLSRTNISVESLDEFTLPAADNTNSLVRTALRPGVEKITFIHHPSDSAGNFLTVTNAFTDSFVTNGVIATQAVQRVTSRPDFIFSAKDLGGIFNGFGLFPPWPSQATDASGWINNSALNGKPQGYGPGNIHGPVQISFHKPSKYIAAAGGMTNSATQDLWNWGSFSGTTNPPVILGSQADVSSLTLSLEIQTNGNSQVLQWTVLGHQNGVYQIDTSTNLVDWNSAGTITNTAGIFIFIYPLDQPQRYFRAALQ